MFQAWNPIENKPGKSDLERLAMHDLAFTGTWSMRLNWEVTPAQPYRGLSTVLVGKDGEARQRRARLRELNPNHILLCAVLYREGRYVAAGREVKAWQQGAYPPDSEFWLRDEDGRLCPGWGDDTDGDGTLEPDEIRNMLVDFRNPKLHELIARKALALKESGVFDGMMLDWWNEDHATTARWPGGGGTHLTREEERTARIAILRKIRKAVGDDFLILVNSNYRTIPRSAPFVNGIFMECYRPEYRVGYDAGQVAKMQATLKWAEQHLRSPRINCLEGWRVVTEYAGDRETRIAERDQPVNRQCMRMITALGLTHSNGYVLFGDHNAQPSPDHLHNWYPFWDTNLGRPLGPGKKHPDGSYRRPFQNGTAVYNPPGNPAVTVLLPSPATSVATAQRDTQHALAPADGDLFVKGASQESGWRGMPVRPSTPTRRAEEKKPAESDTSPKIEFDLTRLDADGLRGPTDGKVAVSYEFCIPNTDRHKAKVKAIDSSVQFMAGSRGRIGAGKDQCLCIGSTHQANFREVLQALAGLTFVERIIECHFE